VIFLAAPYTGLLFGENWTGAGSVLVCMIPLFVGTIIVAPTNHLIAIQKQRLQLFADISRVFLITASIGISIYFALGFNLAVLLCCSSSLCGYLILAGIQNYQHYKLITKSGNV
jgi:O-antigen/teichoic acid export membrane protein